MCVYLLKFNTESIGQSPSKQQFSPTHSGRFFVRRGGLRMTVLETEDLRSLVL